MRRAARLEPPVVLGLYAVLLSLAALPRLLGAAYGLPHVYNADEPHVVNMAVSLAGSLRPFSFKYPTLWPTVLAAAYGLWFAFWSGFGLLRSTLDFTALYAFSPTGFYLIGRLLASAAQLGALVVVARLERGEGDRRWAYGAAVLALSPTLVELAHAAKPDSLMLLLCAGMTAAALRHQQDGRRGWLLLSALLGGLACSTQYTAAPAGLLVPLAWLLCSKGPGPVSWLLQAGLVAALGFGLGTPFAYIDHARFASDWSDYGDLGRLRPYDAVQSAKLVLRNVWCFGGEGTLAGAAAVLGLGALLRRDAKRALLLAIPIVVYIGILSSSFDGTVARYIVGGYPLLALLAGEGFSLLGGEKLWRRGLVLALALAPAAFLCWRQDADLLRPDTRAQSTEWLAQNTKPGDTLLLDQPHAGPFAIMTKEQCAELAERAAKNGSPRARLYRAMAAKHPGGGWRVYRIQRGARDLWSAPRHVAQSQTDGDFLDVRPGLDVARAARVDWVVTSSFGADPRRSRELATFFTELASQADLVKEFPSEPGVSVGPWLRVWRLRR
jgi:hypothetical protein